MKYLLPVVFALVLVVLMVNGRDDALREPSSADSGAAASARAPQPVAPSAEWPAGAFSVDADVPADTTAKRESAGNQDADAALNPDDLAARGDGDGSRVINIGEPMDPDDPSTWPQPASTEVINIGEPMDPDDPSTWPAAESAAIINIGEPMDPDDPYTWPQSENNEVINIGEPMNPDDPYTWPQTDDSEVINIGEPMDPDNPSAWR